MRAYLTPLLTLCFSVLCLVLAGAAGYFDLPSLAVLFLLFFVILALESLCSALHIRRKQILRAMQQPPFTSVEGARRDV